MSLLPYLAFAALGALMLVDEAWYHVRREMPRWERLGHPVDTGVFLGALSWAAFAPKVPASAVVYVALATLSCLVITKDEWVHARHCRGGEHFVHALLFVLHPVALFAAWRLRATGLPLWPILSAVLIFGSWQLVYWNLVKDPPCATPSTTTSTTR